MGRTCFVHVGHVRARISISESLVYLNLKGLEEDGEYPATDFHACLTCKLAGPLPKVVGVLLSVIEAVGCWHSGLGAAAGARTQRRSGRRHRSLVLLAPSRRRRGAAGAAGWSGSRRIEGSSGPGLIVGRRGCSLFVACGATPATVLLVVERRWRAMRHAQLHVLEDVCSRPASLLHG
jgi:hypothetical protein